MIVSRGNLVAGLAGTGLALATASPAAAASTGGKRAGTIGMIKPAITQGPIEEIIPFLPAGLAYVPAYLNFEAGTQSEFEAAMPVYERDIALLAAQQCDMIVAEGAPPFMIQGPQREAEITAAWEKTYGVPLFTSSQNQVRALHALGAKKILGATYLNGPQNKLFAKYFTDVGFTVLGMNGMDVPFATVQDVPSARIADYIRARVAQSPGADVIYILGSGWRILDIIAPLEHELGIPILHPVIARAWEIQKRLHVHDPKPGYGRLMAELPEVSRANP